LQEIAKASRSLQKLSNSAETCRCLQKLVED